jgi:hypothetical protein
MDTLYEIVGYTVPALVVLATVYVLLRHFFRQQYQIELLKGKQAESKNSFPLKLQAYERLAMFCERITIDPLFYRIAHPDMGGQEVKNAMLIAIQQEYEHNVSQQIYVSENLWKIVQAAKEQTQQLVAAANGPSPDAYISNLKEVIATLPGDPLQLAKAAIRNEVRTIL